MDKQIKSLLRSFLYAFRGLWYAIRTQRNMRIHLTAALWVLWISSCFDFTSGERVSLMVTIGMVISTELINTAIEAAVDRQSKNLDNYAKIAKDTASAAVLFTAMISLGVAGVLFFGKPEGFVTFLRIWTGTASGIIVLILAAVLSFVFIFISPNRIINSIKQLMEKKGLFKKQVY